MARYWLPVVILVLIVSSLGTYYVRGTSSHLPEYVLVPQHGDAKEAIGVSARGFYNQAHRPPTVHIRLDGSKYDSGLSLTESLDPYYYSSAAIKQLVKEQRQFMRGKRGELSFYQDDQLLVYAALEEERSYQTREQWFEIAVLDKQNKQTTDHMIPVLELDMYAYTYVEDVQVYGDELIILVSGRFNSSNERAFHRYTIGLTNGEVRNEEALPFSEWGIVEARIVPENNVTLAGKYAVFYTNGQEQPQLIRYDMQAGTMEALQAPEAVEFLEWLSQKEESNLIFVRDGDKLYAMNYEQQGMHILEYDLRTDQAASRYMEEEGVIHAQIGDNRMYMLTKQEGSSSASVIIANLSDGNVLFEGKIEQKEKTNQSADALEQLEVYGVYLHL